MQRFVSRAGTSILDYKERSFALFTTAFRSLDHAIDSEVEEHNKMKEFFSLLEKDRINIRLLQR